MSEEASNIKSILRLKLNDEVQISNDYGSQIEDLSGELSNKFDKGDGGVISNDVEISGVLSIGSNILQGNSLTSENEMTGYACAAFNYSNSFGEYSFAANQGKTYSKNATAFGDSVAYGSYSIAQGTSTSSLGSFSHSEGKQTLAIGDASHAEGIQNYAIANGSHAEGDGDCYAGSYAFRVISCDNELSTVTLDALSCEYGHLSSSGLSGKWIALFQKATALGDGNVSAIFNTVFYGVVDNDANKISVNYIPNYANYKNIYAYFPDYPLYGTVRIGDGAHAHGYGSHAMEDATAFGCYNYALGRYSCAFGTANKVDYMGVAIGTGNSAYGAYSIAMGGNGNASTASFGTNTQVYASKAFGWSGNGKYEIPKNRNGTFNINPVNGINGFFIGSQSLSSIISTAIHDIIDPIAQEFNELNDLADEILT